MAEWEDNGNTTATRKDAKERLDGRTDGRSIDSVRLCAHTRKGALQARFRTAPLRYSPSL